MILPFNTGVCYLTDVTQEFQSFSDIAVIPAFAGMTKPIVNHVEAKACDTIGFVINQ